MYICTDTKMNLHGNVLNFKIKYLHKLAKRYNKESEQIQSVSGKSTNRCSGN